MSEIHCASFPFFHSTPKTSQLTTPSNPPPAPPQTTPGPSTPPPPPTTGLILQRALLICIAACVPISILWLCSNGLLTAMGQEVEIAALASRYLIWCIPCLFLSICSECLRK